MGKFCCTALGLGMAGAIIGLHVYMFIEPKTQRKIKKEFSEAVEDIKKAAGRLSQIG